MAVGNISGTVIISRTSGGTSARCLAKAPVLFGIPTGFPDGSPLRITVTQGTGGPYAVTWDAVFNFPVDEAAGAPVTGQNYAAPGHADIWEFVLESSLWVCRGHWYT